MPFKYNPLTGELNVSGAGSAGTNTDFVTDSGTATPSGGSLNVLGGTGIDTSGLGANLTITAADAVPLSFDTDAGTATPSSNNLDILGGTGITSSGSSNQVTVTLQTATTSQVGGLETATDFEAIAVTAENKIITPQNIAAIFTEPPELGSAVPGVVNGSSGVFTTVDIDGGTIDNTVIGGATPAAVTGTAGTFNSVDVDNINIDGNTIISTDTDGDINLTPNGSGDVVISSADINGGAIDGTSIGASSASTGAFTQLDINIGASGDPKLVFDINGTDQFYIGVDDSDADRLKIGNGATVGTNPLVEFGASFNTVPLAIGEVGGENGSIITTQVSLSGTAWVGVAVAARGSFMGFVSAGSNNFPAATFIVNASGNGGIVGTETILQQSAGVTTGELIEVRWTTTSGGQIEIRKDGAAYDGTYEIMMMGVRGG